MEPQNIHFGGGATATFVNPVVLLIVLAAGLIILLASRQRAVITFLAAAILIPIDQVVLVGSLHFPMLRVLILFGIARLCTDTVLQKRKLLHGGITKIDVCMLLLSILVAVNGIVLFKQWGAVVFQLGNLYTTLGAYFLLRYLIRSEADTSLAARTLVQVAMVIAPLMIWEAMTGHNPYALLGGSRSDWYASLMVRDDRIRAMGSFGHPLLAGSFGAQIIPLSALLWWNKPKNRVLAWAGAVAGTIIVLACNSSTSILAYAAGIISLCLWPARKWTRLIRWAIVCTLICVHLFWSHPVWYLIAKVDLAGGSSSWHRFALIDQCIHHFTDWWLIGVKSTQDWGWDMWDTANWYVGICDSSGLLAFILFIAILVYGFKYLGRARKIAEDRRRRIFLWALASCLFANVVAFLGVSYWDQMEVVWCTLLAMISATAVTRKASKTESDSQPEFLTAEPNTNSEYADLAFQ